MHTDSRGYVRAIAAGDYEEAYLIARGPNPLASICGRVCGAPCEQACRRGDFDKPIAIRALKRFVCDRFGPAAHQGGEGSLIELLKNAAKHHARRQCQGTEELLPLLQATLDEDIVLARGRSVAVIGSGPAGLSAAHDLALLGFSVSIYEAEPVLAGMLAVGIPEYRLPRDLIRAEVDVILAMGVEAVTNCEIGKDVTLAELRRRHDAVIVAVGAKRSRSLTVPGANAKGVIGGVEFLRDMSLGTPPLLSGRVVVIGGGNVAYDVGRTVLRQISVDTARAALREDTVGQVYLCSLESLDEMPADDLEIIEGDEEGIVRRNSMGPVEILTDDGGAVRGVVFRRCLRVYDEQRRFAPQFDDDARETIECENVLLAVGQSVDLSFIDATRDGIELTERGFLACDADSGRTAAADIFVAGDLAYGPKLLIHAVASGKKVARAVYESLTGRTIRHRDVELHLALADYARDRHYDRRDRVAMRTSTPAERMRSWSTPVELGYLEGEARTEAQRCFDCGVNTIFDGEKCILCGGCADVCPSLCLRIVSTDRLPQSPGLDDLLRHHLHGTAAERASAIIKDEMICIRCGLCAERCPSGAITMERFFFEEVPTCRVA